MKALLVTLVFYIVACALGPHEARSADDPTFNGIAKVLHCSISQPIACQGDYCTVIPASTSVTGNYWIDWDKRQVGNCWPAPTQQGCVADQKIDLIAVSPAALNSKLYVKFQHLDHAGNRQYVWLAFFPTGGGYKVTIALRSSVGKSSQGPSNYQLISGGFCKIHRQ